MSKNVKDRQMLVIHKFHPAAYQDKRCSLCGHGFDYLNPDYSPVHEEARAEMEKLMSRQKHSPVTDFLNAQAVPDPQLAGYEQALRDAANGSDQFQRVSHFNAENAEQAVPVTQPRQNVVFTNAGENGVVVSVDQDVIDAVQVKMAAAAWDIQTFVDLMSHLWRAAREAGSHAALEVSRAHRADLADFKQQVANVALKYAITHDWCDEVVECLRELGIEPLGANVSVDLGHRVQLLLPLSDIHQYRRNPERWARETIGQSDGEQIQIRDVELGPVSVLQ